MAEKSGVANKYMPPGPDAGKALPESKDPVSGHRGADLARGYTKEGLVHDDGTGRIREIQEPVMKSHVGQKGSKR